MQIEACRRTPAPTGRTVTYNAFVMRKPTHSRIQSNIILHIPQSNNFSANFGMRTRELFLYLFQVCSFIREKGRDTQQECVVLGVPPGTRFFYKRFPLQRNHKSMHVNLDAP